MRKMLREYQCWVKVSLLILNASVTTSNFRLSDGHLVKCKRYFHQSTKVLGYLPICLITIKIKRTEKKNAFHGGRV